MNGNGRTITLNEKGMLLLGVIILTLVFALGFMTSSKRKQDRDVTIFTEKDLDRIVKMHQAEDDMGSGAEIYAYKDADGNLMIGWHYEDSKR